MQKLEEHMVNNLKTNVSYLTGCFAGNVNMLLYHLSFDHSTHSKVTLLSLFLPLACVYELHSEDSS
jgi:hypothetical protein